MKSTWKNGIVVLAVVELLWGYGSGYVGSYVARISDRDHYSSRGNHLNKTSDILQQDRANYHRFGIRDSEDEWDSYFSSRRHRSQMGYLLLAL